MEEFIRQNWVYIAAGLAILILYQVDGKPLYKVLLEKLQSNKPAVEPVYQDAVPAIQPQPIVEVPQVKQYDKALAVTLLGHDYQELTIRRDKQ